MFRVSVLTRRALTLRASSASFPSLAPEGRRATQATARRYRRRRCASGLFPARNASSSSRSPTAASAAAAVVSAATGCALCSPFLLILLSPAAAAAAAAVPVADCDADSDDNLDIGAAVPRMTPRETAAEQLLLATLLPVVRAAGDSNNNNTNNNNNGSVLPPGLDLQALALAGGFGVLPGFCAGFALRKVGNIAVAGVGAVFFMFQAAAYQGYVTIHWDAIERDLNRLLDLNGDGALNSGDEAAAQEKLHEVVGMLTHNTSTAMGGFTVGFFAGWRTG